MLKYERYKRIFIHKLIMVNITAKFEFLVLLFVITVLMSSGCVNPLGGGQTSYTTGPGIVIEKFDTPLGMVESGEATNLHLEIRNQGEYDGELGIGAPAIVELMQIDPSEWIIEPSPIMDLGTVLAPDAESQTSGGLSKMDGRITAPLLQAGQRQTQEIAARVYYQYETKARKAIQFVTNEEMRRMVQSGETFTSDPLTQTAGPLTVTMNTGQIVPANELKNHRFQIQLRIDNTGSGQVRGENYPVAVEVKYPAWVIPADGYCPSQTIWGTPIYTDVPAGLPQPVGNFVYVWDGRTTDITCEFEIIQPPASKTKGNFDITLGYIYSVEQTIQLEVKGTESF